MSTIQVAMCVLLSSALPAQAPPVPPKGGKAAEKPAPPLKLSRPRAPAKTHGGEDLKDADADELASRAHAAARQKDFEGAAKHLHLAELTEPGGRGYDLAYYCAKAKRVDDALYWLQHCAMGGLGPSARGPDRARGHDPKTALPVIIALHDLASRPEDFSGEPEQGLANRWQVAFLPVSGTRARGPESFVWSEDPEANRRHVMAALERVKDKVTVKKGHLILMGFSQGAQVAFEVTIRDPVAFAGAIAMSPGFRGPTQLDDAKRSPLLAKRAYVLTSYSGEHINTVKRASADATWAREAGALVIEHTFPGSVHAFPPHYGSNLSAYLQTILGVKERFGK